MLRINSSVSSGRHGGPSTRCRIPCTRMVGEIPTRIWRSAAPSDTTNCNKSDIEYDMLVSPLCSQESLRVVAHRRTNHFFRRGHSRQNLADAVLAQSAHAHLARAGAQHGRGHFVVDQFARVVIYDEHFKETHAAAATAAVAIRTALALP